MSPHSKLTTPRTFQKWIDIVDDIMPRGHSVGHDIVRETEIARRVISPGERLTLFGVSWTDETRQLINKVRDVEVTICYHSLLDDYWASNSSLPMPVSVEDCTNSN